MTIPPSAEAQRWCAKQARIRTAYFRILFQLYEEDMLPPNYIAPHLRRPRTDDRPVGQKDE